MTECLRRLAKNPIVIRMYSFKLNLIYFLRTESKISFYRCYICTFLFKLKKFQKWFKEKKTTHKKCSTLLIKSSGDCNSTAINQIASHYLAYFILFYFTNTFVFIINRGVIRSKMKHITKYSSRMSLYSRRLNPFITTHTYIHTHKVIHYSNYGNLIVRINYNPSVISNIDIISL